MEKQLKLRLLISKLEAFRDKQYITWNEVAQGVGVSLATLKRFRNEDTTKETIQRVEEFLDSKRDLDNHLYKDCTLCGGRLPREKFNTNKLSRDGKQPNCAECHNNRSRQFRDSNKEYHRRYREVNKKDIQNYSTVKNASVSAKKYGVKDTLEVRDWEEIRERFDNTCLYCGNVVGDGVTIEHVVPFSSGGSNVRCNVITACLDCNIRKHSTDIDVWYPKQEFYNEDIHMFIKQRIGE